MARKNPPTKKKEVGPLMHVFKLRSGKFHEKVAGEIKTTTPGQTVIRVPEGLFLNTKMWEDLGPVGSVTLPEEKIKGDNTLLPKLRKIECGDGTFEIVRIELDGEEIHINDAPLTEEEADNIIKAALEGGNAILEDE